jgi:RNA-directed DNA polymerase
MKVPNGEGLASHAVPESCGCLREEPAEALTGVRAGWVLSPERIEIGVPTRILWRGRPHCCGSIFARVAADAAGSQTPRMHARILHGSREIPGAAPALAGVRAANPEGTRRQ